MAPCGAILFRSHEHAEAAATDTLHRFLVRPPSRRRHPCSSEKSAYRVQVPELVDHGATSRVQKEIVALVAVACAFKNFRGDKAARGSGSGRDVAADFFKNTSHSRYGLRIEFTHCCSLTNPLSLAARADAFRPVEDRKNQYCILKQIDLRIRETNVRTSEQTGTSERTSRPTVHQHDQRTRLVPAGSTLCFDLGRPDLQCAAQAARQDGCATSCPARIRLCPSRSGPWWCRRYCWRCHCSRWRGPACDRR